MPWKETSTVELRRCFIRDYLRRFLSIADLCRDYGISRPTGYKWIRRFEAEGMEGLRDRSRKPHSCSHQVPDPIVEELVRDRKRHPTWGARKLLVRIARRHPDWHLPAPSTAHEVLKRHGLIPRRRKRPKRPHPGRPMTPMDEPNAVWTADFKGQFKTLDGHYCYPLTVQDGFSRFLLACEGLPRATIRGTKPVFKRLFQEYGLPQRIRTDNGPPFAANSLGRISQLAVWWIRLGIIPELIEPGKPQQNGRHERMHRTLKGETARPPQPNRRAQQLCFDRFRAEFNHERPHEAIGQRCPAELYVPSSRSLPKRLPRIDYPAHFEVRKVSTNGGIRWANQWVNVSKVLEGQYIGLEEVDDGLWHIFFAHVFLGYLHDDLRTVEDRAGFISRHRKNLSAMSPD